ncbi:transglycosylase domain-containing protein [uncultured Paenibacillus sp.]|uniref:transglycosylase domain-containing protein n=1 Tax=uncultured Paenibacillus sp. TaxID=227322 RepID=UPI0028D015E4|nr:transglycosylase domain-containing protein [uncultured Paenibacillus sp.]
MEEIHKPSKRSGWRTFGLVAWITFKWLFIFGVLIALFAGGALTGYVASLVKDDPVRPRSTIEAKIGENATTGFVYFNDNTPVGQLRTEEDRRLVALDDVPKSVIDAVLAIEDNNFEDHIGVDVKGLGRALKQKLLNEEIQTGGSTLTQQLARRVFLNLDVSDSRKVKEIFLALRLERFLTKKEILAAYLNKVPFGNGYSGYNLYGIKAAAKGIFNINDLNDLNIAQSAYLAGLPQRPSAYTAFNSKGEYNEEGIGFAIDRQRLVLRRMLETGRITAAAYEEALAFDIRSSLAKPQKKAYNTFPYLMLEAERQAAEIMMMQQDPSLTLGEIRKPENAAKLEEARESLLRGGYHIFTTIDKKIYNLMRAIGSDPDNFTPDSKEKGVEQAAAVMLDNNTGAILGMLEGRDFYLEQMNYATQMTRQPGSTMKPIAAYLPAIDAGLIQPASILDDAPIVLKDGQKGFHIPRNATNNYRGLVTAREALNRSLNLPALKLFLDKVTIPKAWEFARKLGITTIQAEDDYAQTGVIGGLSKGVTVEELTNAYSAIPNGGVFNDAYMISRITDGKGKVVYEHKTKPARVFSEQTAFLVSDMLRTVITNGTGSTVKREFKGGSIPVAGKTGSTQSYGDVWFMGFTPDITLGVWAGYEQQIFALTGDGKRRAQQIWAKIMNEVVAAKPELFATREFSKPDGVVKATVSGVSGKRPTDLTKQMGRLVTDWFNESFLPKEDDDAIVKMAFIPYNGINYIAQPTTPSDFVRERTVVRREKPLDVLFEEIAAAQEKLPADSRQPMSFYLPADADLDAPSKVDPRTDDGGNPSPPSGIALQPVDGTAALRIGFQPAGQNDIVGYRLYRSVNGGPFQKSGDSIVVGEQSRFISYISSGNAYSFYVTAVDVAGRESVPSAIAATGVSSAPPAASGDGDTAPLSDSDAGVPAPDGAGGELDVPAPSAPGGLTVKSIEIGVELSWSPNPVSEQIREYIVYYSENGTSQFRQIGTVQEPRFEYIAPFTAGTFRVTAVNANGESDPSPAASPN